MDAILTVDGKRGTLYDADNANKITSKLWEKVSDQRIQNDQNIYVGGFEGESFSNNLPIGIHSFYQQSRV